MLRCPVVAAILDFILTSKCQLCERLFIVNVGSSKSAVSKKKEARDIFPYDLLLGPKSYSGGHI